MQQYAELKENYWRILSGTRKSGRIAQSVKSRVEEEWKRFDRDVVAEALRIHVDKYKGYKENYTIGIMRNLQKKKEITGSIRKENQFNQYMKNDYDFEALEREIVCDL